MWLLMRPHTADSQGDKIQCNTLYKKSVQSLQANWIGLKLSPPLLLGLTKWNTKENDGQQWAEVDRTAGFHTHREDTTTEPWDAREAVKAMKDEDLD